MRTAVSLALLLACTWLLAGAESAEAIPAFARRYETSCQTCHVAFPRLTPFGEAFRRNAYRFPGGGDETAQKEEPLALGTEVHQEIWPQAVWPGEMPRSLPLSMTLNGQAIFGGGHGGHGAEATPADSHGGGSQVDLGSLGGQIGMRAGGTLGSAAAVFASIDFGGHEPVAVERGFVLLTPWDPTALQVRLGRFDPALHGVSIHRSLLPHDQPINTTAVGLNPFAPEPSVNGVEVSGVAFGHCGWAVGAVENATPGSFNVKDVYGRFEAKIGGMRLDGLHAEAGKAAWSERSLLIGLGGWLGRAALVKDGKHLRDDPFLRLGADLHAVWDDLLLDVVAARQQHDGPLAAVGEVTADLLSAELTWMVTAFVFPTLRLDAVRQDVAGKTETGWTAKAQATAVVRPNLLLRVQAGYGADAGDHADFQSAALSFAAAF